MATASAQTLFGFGADLDWRPTRFMTPFPLNKVCSVCGLVPPWIATLCCRHLLCEPCYERSIAKHGLCPLDMKPVRDRNAVWTTTSKESVLDRRVRCWNAENGCETEDTAREMLSHFASGCEFHAMPCPKCGEKVLHRDILGHLEAPCEPRRRREQPVGDNLVNAVLEVKEALEKISQENARLQRKLDSFKMEALSSSVAEAVTAAVERTSSVGRAQTEAVLSAHRLEVASQVQEAAAFNEQTIRRALSHECDRQLQAFKEEVTEQVTEGHTAVDAALAFLAKEVNEKNLKQKGETRSMELLAAVSLFIQSDVLNVSLPYEWIITDWTAFCAKKDASREYFSSTQGEARYYFGYLIIPQLCFSPAGDCIWFRVNVLKGLFDNFLTWPMEKKLKACFLHPVSPQNNVVLTTGLEWIAPAGSLSAVAKEVVCTGYSESISVDTLRWRYFFANCDYLRLQLHFVSSLSFSLLIF